MASNIPHSCHGTARLLLLDSSRELQGQDGRGNDSCIGGTTVVVQHTGTAHPRGLPSGRWRTRLGGRGDDERPLGEGKAGLPPPSPHHWSSSSLPPLLLLQVAISSLTRPPSYRLCLCPPVISMTGRAPTAPAPPSSSSWAVHLPIVNRQRNNTHHLASYHDIHPLHHSSPLSLRPSLRFPHPHLITPSLSCSALSRPSTSTSTPFLTDEDAARQLHVSCVFARCYAFR